MPTSELTSQKGQRVRATFVTYTHGPTITPLLEKFGAKPKVSSKSVLQMSSQIPGLQYRIHEGGTFDWETVATNRAQAINVLADRPPAQTAGTNLDITRYRPFHMVGTKLADSADVAVGSIFVYEALANSLAEEMMAGDAIKYKISGDCKLIADLQGLDMRYVRITSGTPPLAIPTITSLAEGAGTSQFKVGDVVSVRVAQSSNANTGATPPPLAASPSGPGEPLTPASPIAGLVIAVATDQVTLTVPAVAAGKSVAVYVGKKYGEEVFAGWIAAGGTTFTITQFPDITNPRPLFDDNSGAFATTAPAIDQQLVSNVSGGVTYPNSLKLTNGGSPAPVALDQKGTRAVAVLLNGLLVPDVLDGQGKFTFSVDGTVFAWNAVLNPADVIELILPVPIQP